MKIYIIDYIVSNIFIGLYSFFVTGGRKKSIKMPYIYVIDINFRYENVVHFVQIPMSATGTHTCASVYNLYKYISIYKRFKLMYFINNDIFIISICKPPTYLMVYNARK